MSKQNVNTIKDPMESLIERTLAYFEKGRALTIAQKTAATAVKGALDTELNTFYSYIDNLSKAPVTKNTATLFTHPKKDQPILTQPLKKAFAL